MSIDDLDLIEQCMLLLIYLTFFLAIICGCGMVRWLWLRMVEWDAGTAREYRRARR